MSPAEVSCNNPPSCLLQFLPKFPLHLLTQPASTCRTRSLMNTPSNLSALPTSIALPSSHRQLAQLEGCTRTSIPRVALDLVPAIAANNAPLRPGSLLTPRLSLDNMSPPLQHPGRMFLLSFTTNNALSLFLPMGRKTNSRTSVLAFLTTTKRKLRRGGGKTL